MVAMAEQSLVPEIVPLNLLAICSRANRGVFVKIFLVKRVDYSGRSVIVIGPELKASSMWLPKKMALILFEPFIIRRLKELGFVHTVAGAEK